LGVNGSAQVLNGNLNNRWYYFHARAADGAYWGGNVWRLISNSKFNVCPDGILEPSYLAPFREIDTGNYTGFTVTLV
jgi:hypothetical protein